MISVSWNTLLLVYLGLLLGILFTLWVKNHFFSKSISPPLIEKESITCPFCLTQYLREKRTAICRCPICNLLSEPESKKGHKK